MARTRPFRCPATGCGLKQAEDRFATVSAQRRGGLLGTDRAALPGALTRGLTGELTGHLRAGRPGREGRAPAPRSPRGGEGGTAGPQFTEQAPDASPTTLQEA
ncbi:hypothetical protein HNQ09_001422 [Deinococcus budaensis]|uniref:Uncharacterized protein n=1 Tax=Deinococcus budaensis TaxID=1665626 RepID=A0A7W8GEQ3_9DEIO|nr:hypothetical protein [Deinococcus budaensis]